MDYKKAKKQLKKIKTLLDSFESLEEPISKMEADLLRKYADLFKEIIPHGSAEPTPEPVKAIRKKKEPVLAIVEDSVVDQVKEEVIEEILPIPEEEFDVPPVEEKVLVEKTPSKVNIEKIDEVKAPIEEIKIPEVKIPRKTRKKLVAEVEDEGDTNINLWEPVAIKDLSQKLSFSPIKDIHKAISINERIFTQNELFGGDHLLFRSTLEKLDTFNNFDEAVVYLKKGVAKDQNWESAKVRKKAIQFMHLVQRRYL